MAASPLNLAARIKLTERIAKGVNGMNAKQIIMYTLEVRDTVLNAVGAGKSIDAAPIPDFDGMIDNAAGASQSRELLDDAITRGAVKANIYDPLVRLIQSYR